MQGQQAPLVLPDLPEFKDQREVRVPLEITAQQAQLALQEQQAWLDPQAPLALQGRLGMQGQRDRLVQLVQRELTARRDRQGQQEMVVQLVQLVALVLQEMPVRLGRLEVREPLV